MGAYRARRSPRLSEKNITKAMTGPRLTMEGSSAQSSLGDVPWIVGDDPSPTLPPSPTYKTQDLVLHLEILVGDNDLPKAAQMFESEIRMEGLGLSLLTIRAGLRSQESLDLATLCSHSASKFSNPGSQRSISTRTFLLRTILRTRNCLIISQNSARSWRLSSNTPMPRKSSERRNKMPGRTAGSAGGRVTSWKN